MQNDFAGRIELLATSPSALVPVQANNEMIEGANKHLYISGGLLASCQSVFTCAATCATRRCIRARAYYPRRAPFGPFG